MNCTKALMLVVAGTFGLAIQAQAQTATTTFEVRMTVESVCTIDTPAATDVDFGTHESSAVDVEASGLINVNCTPGTSYSIALDEGLNAGGAGVAGRNMDSGTDLLPYQLYSDAARTLVWGDTDGVDTVSGTGTGDVQPLPVYGLVPSANVPAASYLDVITATVTY